MKSHYETIIIGGGITGTWAAKKLTEKNKDFALISVDIGGLLGQVEKDGFKFDMSGGHVYGIEDHRIRELMTSIDHKTMNRLCYYRHGNEFVPYPVQDHSEKIGIHIDRRDEPKMLPKYERQSLESYVTPIFGKEFVDNWFAPFNRRVWTADISKMDSDWMQGRVKLTKRVKEDWGPNKEFYYASGPDIFDKIKEGLDPDRLIEDFVVYVDTTKRKINLSSGRTVEYDCLIYTPSIRFISHEFAIDALKLKSNRIMNLCIGLNHKLDMMEDFHWYYADVRTSRGHRVTKISNYGSLSPENSDSFMIEFPFYAQSILTGDTRYDKANWKSIGSWMRQADIPKELAASMANEAGLSINEKSISVALLTETSGYPIPTLNVRSEVATIKQMMMNRNVFPAGRFGSHGYFNINHCMDEAELLVDILCGQDDALTTHDYLYSTFYYGLYSSGVTPEDYLPSK